MYKPTSNPFLEGDFSKLMTDFKMPMFNFEALMATQRKNIEAMTAVNQAAFENMQGLMRKQAELMRQGLEESAQMMNAVLSPASPEEKVIRHVEVSKAAVDKCMANVREIAETMAKTNSQAMDTVSTRMNESLEELRDMIKTSSRTAAAA